MSGGLSESVPILLRRLHLALRGLGQCGIGGKDQADRGSDGEPGLADWIHRPPGGISYSMNMHFDTLAAVKRIEAAGLDRAAAEAVVAEIAAAQIELADKQDVTLILRDAAATKTELEAGLGSVRGEIAALGTATKAEFANVRGEIAALGPELRAEIATSKAELRTEIAAAKNDVIRWMFGSQAFLIVTLVALAQFTKLL